MPVTADRHDLDVSEWLAVIDFLHTVVTAAHDERDPCTFIHDQLLDLRLKVEAGP